MIAPASDAPIRSVVAATRSSSASVSSSSPAVAASVPRSTVSAAVFERRITVWFVAVTVPSRSMSSAWIVSVPAVEDSVSPAVRMNVSAPASSAVTVTFVAPPDVRFSSTVSALETVMST